MADGTKKTKKEIEYWNKVKEYERYQVMCEARVFSQCPTCKKDWEECKCQ